MKTPASHNGSSMPRTMLAPNRANSTLVAALTARNHSLTMICVIGAVRPAGFWFIARSCELLISCGITANREAFYTIRASLGDSMRKQGTAHVNVAEEF